MLTAPSTAPRMARASSILPTDSQRRAGAIRASMKTVMERDGSNEEDEAAPAAIVERHANQGWFPGTRRPVRSKRAMLNVCHPFVR